MKMEITYGGIMIGLRRVRRLAVAALLITLSAAAQDLSNQSFTLKYDGTGIRSLKRTSDKYDTDYIAPNAALGRLMIRYRSTPNGDWRELRDAMRAGGAATYVLGMLKPTLASKASPAAV